MYKKEGGITYTPGKLHTFTIRIDKKGDGSGYSLALTNQAITDWEADLTSHDFEANSYLVVDCPTPGHLKEKIQESGADYTSVKNLKVTGTLNGDDFYFMRDEMSQLTSLNLKDVNCVDAVMHYSDGRPVPEHGLADNFIASHAFANNDNLRRLILPETITHIGESAFENLSLTSTLIIPESVTHIEEYAFHGLGNKATIVLPNKLIKIGKSAFERMNATMELKLPTTLKYIGKLAFAETPNIYGSFSLPAGLEFIGDYAFGSCGNNMTGEIVIPNAIVDVPSGFEIRFANGTTLTLHEGVRSIAERAFPDLRFNAPVILPKSIEKIGREAFYSARFCNIVKLPEKLRYIANGAFLESNFSGEFIFPDEIDNISERSFSGIGLTSLKIGDNVLQIFERSFDRNNELRYIELGRNIEYIGENAFSELPMLQTFVCLTKEPPKAGNAFSEIHFDKCILEVPEGCVDAYRNADGWKQFRNITEHRELAFNIQDIACLNAGKTLTGILRAEGPWKVSECPSWVHITPSLGDYKEEITVTVDAQDIGSPSRDGEIVFSLDGKNYTTYTSVRQLSYEHPEHKEIILQTASSGGNEIPVFIVGEGFTADQIANGEYLNRMNETMEQFFDIEPYRTLRDKFTVTTAIACSSNEGAMDASTSKGNCFGTDGVEPDAWKLREYTEKVSEHAGKNLGNSLIIMVTNMKAFAGWSNIDYDGCAIASVGIIEDAYPFDQRGLVQHYAGGRAFAGLGEESVGHFEHIKGCTCPYCNKLNEFREMKQRGFLENLSMSAKMNDAPWRDFIFHEKYSKYVDMWEGGYNHLRGVWRSEANSVMNTYIRYFNAISRFTIYKAAMRRAGRDASFEEFVNIDKFETPEQ